MTAAWPTVAHRRARVCILIQKMTGAAMLKSPLPVRLLCPLLLGCCLLLQGCGGAAQSAPATKIAMHIDAVLEFAVEYPQDWHKDRRLSYGSRDGEVRWSHPEHPATLLRIKSSLLSQPAVSPARQLEQALQEYSGLEVLRREQVALTAGEAWHVTGRTAQLAVDLYLLPRTQRAYLIVLTAPPGTSSQDDEFMERVTRSFQVLP